MALHLVCDVCGKGEQVPRTHATTFALQMTNGGKVKVPNMDGVFVDLCQQCFPAYGATMVNQVRRTLGVAPRAVPMIQEVPDGEVLTHLGRGPFDQKVLGQGG